jgi:hypothetical protein
MKQTKSGLILPDMPTFTPKTIAEYEPVTPEELHQNMIIPISQALAQGVPPEQPTAVPLEAMARLIKTIQEMGRLLGNTEAVIKPLLDDETIPEEVRNQLKGLFAPQIDLDALGLEFSESGVPLVSQDVWDSIGEPQGGNEESNDK